MRTIKGALFDLDGVIVDTAKYHYLAWKRLAGELGFDFTERDNERLKGVSRARSLEILLQVGGIAADSAARDRLAAKKNEWYVESLRTLDSSALLPGARAYLESLRGEGVLVALGSASKNARLILERLGIVRLFDAIIDGTCVSAAKPDPEVFLKGAGALGLSPRECAVFEDSLAGIQAAKAGGMYAIGVGSPLDLPGADRYISVLADMLHAPLSAARHDPGCPLRSVI